MTSEPSKQMQAITKLLATSPRVPSVLKAEVSKSSGSEGAAKLEVVKSVLNNLSKSAAAKHNIGGYVGEAAVEIPIAAALGITGFHAATKKRGSDVTKAEQVIDKMAEETQYTGALIGAAGAGTLGSVIAKGMYDDKVHQVTHYSISDKAHELIAAKNKVSTQIDSLPKKEQLEYLKTFKGKSPYIGAALAAATLGGLLGHYSLDKNNKGV